MPCVSVHFSKKLTSNSVTKLTRYEKKHFMVEIQDFNHSETS